MAVQCPKCGKQYDVTLFQFDREIVCTECGTRFGLNKAQVREYSKGLSSAGQPSSRRLIIRVESIEGYCPVYREGDLIVLDEGYRVNLAETDNICMHSLASLMPYYVAIYNGVNPKNLGLACKNGKPGVAYVQCLDPCELTGGGTVTFSISREG